MSKLPGVSNLFSEASTSLADQAYVTIDLHFTQVGADVVRGDDALIVVAVGAGAPEGVAAFCRDVQQVGVGGKCVFGCGWRQEVFEISERGGIVAMSPAEDFCGSGDEGCVVRGFALVAGSGGFRKIHREQFEHDVVD